jgi:hypothetical protein
LWHLLLVLALATIVSVSLPFVVLISPALIPGIVIAVPLPFVPGIVILVSSALIYRMAILVLPALFSTSGAGWGGGEWHGEEMDVGGKEE